MPTRRLNSKKQNRGRRNRTQKRKQNGGRVSLPIQYFGGQLNRYFPAGSSQLNSLPSAYGETIARSFGTSVPSLTKLNAVAPNLGPTGLGSNGKSLSCNQQTGGKRNNKRKQTGGKKKSLSKSKAARKIQKKWRNKRGGGAPNSQVLDWVKQNRYFPSGSPQLNSLPSAYGQTVARSFGTSVPSLSGLNSVAPNYGPAGLDSNGKNLSCGVQTGGGRKRTLRTRNQIKLRQKSYAKGRKTSKCVNKGPAVCRSLKECKYASGKKRSFCRKSSNKNRK